MLSSKNINKNNEKTDINSCCFASVCSTWRRGSVLCFTKMIKKTQLLLFFYLIEAVMNH